MSWYSYCIGLVAVFVVTTISGFIADISGIGNYELIPLVIVVFLLAIKNEELFDKLDIIKEES